MLIYYEVNNFKEDGKSAPAQKGLSLYKLGDLAKEEKHITNKTTAIAQKGMVLKPEYNRNFL